MQGNTAGEPGILPHDIIFHFINSVFELHKTEIILPMRNRENFSNILL